MKYKIYFYSSILCGLFSILGDAFNMGILGYFFFALFLMLSLIQFTKIGNNVVNRKYLMIFLLYIFVILINAFVSKYTTGLKYVAIGTLMTILPFILFFVSYNYGLSRDKIEKLIDGWIHFILILCIIAVLETLISPSSSSQAVIKVTFIKPGFFASMCNQALIMSLYKYSSWDNRKYRNLAILFTISALLTVQIKVVIGIIIIWMLYMWYFVQKSKAFKITAITIILLPIVALAMLIQPMYNKVIKYVTLYGGSQSYQYVARPALYYQAVNISNDHFPLGSGQGTYGSIPVNMVYNQVYYDYNLNHIHGLGETGDDFKMDTHWASVIGENGYLGTLLYILLFFFPIRYVRKAKGLPKFIQTKFFIQTVLIIVAMESITLCIPTRFSFMFIYSGIMGLLCRAISREADNLSLKKMS